MDYLIDGIIIVFLLSVIIYLFNAAKGISSSKNFPTPKDDSEKKENDSGVGLMTEKEKIGSKSRNLEQVRRMSVDKRPK